MGHRSYLVRTTMLIALLAATLLSACLPPWTATFPRPGEYRGSPAATIAPTLTPIPTQMATATVTLTLTPQPTPSPALARKPSPAVTPTPSLTPTLGPPVTRTPSPPAVCPQPSGETPTIALDSISDFVASVEAQILAYLNARGSATGLQSLLNTLTIPDEDVEAKVQVATIDVTGDTTPDVVVDFTMHFEEYGFDEGAVYVFSCGEGQYEGGTVMPLGGQYLTEDDPDGIRAIRDMNRNGVPEIVVSSIFNIGVHAYFDRIFFILEWDGTQFVHLIRDDLRGGGSVAPVFNGDGAIRDTDGDGTLELVLTNGIAPYYADEGPQRSRTDIWVWNGVAFTLARWEHTPPEYRFQAIHDGDDATRSGDYDKALAFYQQAIFDEHLLGWSQGQLWPDSAYEASPTPTPDPHEHPRLSAYARYRIMLLHVVQGFMPEAQIVYETLQDKLPAGAVGHQYAKLATVFWGEYNAGEDIAAACGKAIEYASAHADEVLTPLGSGFYGSGQRDYAPEDICPLK